MRRWKRHRMKFRGVNPNWTGKPWKMRGFQDFDRGYPVDIPQGKDIQAPMEKGNSWYGQRFQNRGHGQGKWGSFPQVMKEDEFKTKVKEVLTRVTFGRNWYDCRGIEHRELVMDGQPVGEVYGEVNLVSLEPGNNRVTGRGVKVFLLSNGFPVGHLWIM